MSRSWRVRRRQRTTAVALVALAFLSAACGTRRSHDEVVLGARGNLELGSSGLVEATPGAGLRAAGAEAGSTSPTAGGTSPGTAGADPGATPTGDGGESVEAAAPTAAGSTVVIGNVGTYSGPAGPSLSAISVGARVWARAVNERGGLNGHPVDLVIADDGGDAARHQALVRELVEQRGAIAFVGNGEAVTGAGSVGYLTERGIPVVGSEGANQYFYESPVYFPQQMTGDALLQGSAFTIAEDAKGRGLTRVGIIACIEVQVCTDSYNSAESTYARYGMQIVYKSQASFFEASYTAQCLNAQRAGVEVLSLGMDPGSVSRIAADCAVQGFRPVMAFGGSIVVSNHAGDANLDGSIIYNSNPPWFDGSTPAQAEFLDAMAQFAPDVEPSAGHLQGWVSGKVLELAAGALGESPTPQALLEGLWTVHGDVLPELTGPLLYNHGAPATPSVCGWTVTISDGAFATGGGRRCTELP